MARRIINRGLTNLVTPVMLGRSNSLSINTGAANSPLYAPINPSPLSSSVSFPPPSPAKPSIPIPEQRRSKFRPHDPKAKRDVTADEAPWLNPNWKPPSQPDWKPAPTSDKFSVQNREIDSDEEPDVELDEKNAPWLFDGFNNRPPRPPTPVLTEEEQEYQDEAPPEGYKAPPFSRDDLTGPGPRKKLTPRSGSQQPAAGSQPQQGGGLFGNNAQTSQPQQSGGLFGNTNTTTSQTPQPQQSGGLFGNNNTTTQTSQPQQSGGLFGNNNTTTQTSQPQQSGGLFGNTTTQTSQPQGGSSMFGGSLFGGNQQSQTQQNTQQTSTGGLFGNTQSQQEQKPASGGLFGGGQTTNQTQQPAGGSLFGGMQSNTTQQPAGTGSLFGGTTTQKPSLFGANTTTQQPASNSLFGGLNQSQNQQPQQQQPTQTSLLGASRYAQSQYQPFVTGRLTMGQGQGGAPQPTTTPATKLDWSNVRNTTRFNDLTDEAKQDIEKIDKLIADQEDFCKQIEAFLPNHANNLATLGPDVTLITDKIEEVDRSLALDAHGVQQDKNITEKDEIDIARCIRIIDNLRMPSQYIYQPAANSGRQPQPPAWDETYDVDLVGNYFQPLTKEMARLLATYSGNLAEIESHMGTIEQSALSQAHQLAAQRSGLGGRDVGADSVRQLADTLRGFEASILSAAGKVGGCREGVNELVLGKVAPQSTRRAW